jgi:DNA excision repair protein ERCC-2
VTIQIDDLNRTVTLSVRDFCDVEATGGSLNLSPLMDIRSDIGRSIHADYQTSQARNRTDYRKEQTVRFMTHHRGHRVVIQGRIDGVYGQNGETVLEEIKSVLTFGDDFRPESLPVSYVLQLKIYLYLWMQLYPHQPVSGRLVLISCEPERVVDLKVEPDVPTVEALIAERLEKIIGEHEEARRRLALKEAKADSISFPFSQVRKHQDRMIEAIENALEEHRHLLVSAPTGIGKTVAALYATLRFAARHHLSIFFLTSKTTQQRIVADTLRLWRHPLAASTQGNPSHPIFHSLILRSKEKSCANDVVFCHESRCRYAKDFFQKLNDSNVRDCLLQESILTPELIYARALEEEICPFELSLEMTRRVDLTVCDYNYVYDPRVAIQRFGESDLSRTILIVDEAHNLYARARDYYSPSLELSQIQSLRKSIALTEGAVEDSEARGMLARKRPAEPAAASPSRSFLGRLETFLRCLEDYFQEVAEAHPELRESNQAVVALNREFFRSLREELDDLMRRYLIYQRRTGHIQDEDRLLQFFYTLSDFCRVLALEGDEFVHMMDVESQEPQLRIICLDPARQLQKRHQRCYAVVAMSATLSPMEFYRDVLGFERDTPLLELPSPFPRENRKILVIPEVSTEYRQRSRHLSKIAQIIEEAVAVRPGNYFAFFPSFEFLKEVAGRLNVLHAEILIQNRFMPDHQRNALLEKLADPGKSHLVLAVQGGVFAEGVDYPGELAVGAIIVGPGLPKVSFEVELMRQYYEDNYARGFDYAYLYPGMNRVVQSAGRIVRSESDRGVILLLDKRFTYENYARLFPRDWYELSPAELIAKDYREALVAFWGVGQTNG